MADPIPVNLSAIQQRAAQREAKLLVAEQVSANAKFTEEVEEGGINPVTYQRELARRDRFRPMRGREKKTESSEKKVTEVQKKSEDDLAQNYNRRNPELPANKLRQLRDALKSGQTPSEILEEVEAAFEDATLADEALEYLEKETDGSIRDNVRAARELLLSQKGREVIAGRNTESAVRAYQKGIGRSATELRNLYREVTGNPRDHNTLFTELSEEYDFDQLKLVVAFLLKGMSYDLKSKGPSIQQAELMRLMTETRNLQSILWVYFFFKGRMGLLKSLYDQYGLTLSERLTFERLAKQFIKLVEERYPSVMKLLKQMENFGVLDDLEKMLIITQYRDAIRGLSPRLYKSLRHRQDLLLVILQTLEELEDRFEEMEDESDTF